MPENENDTDLPSPGTLLPSEVVCREPNCNLAYHRHLPACPTCYLEIRGR